MVRKETIVEGKLAEKVLQRSVTIEVNKKAKLGQDVIIWQSGTMQQVKAEEAIKKSC